MTSAIILTSSRSEKTLTLTFVKNQDFVALMHKIVGQLHLDWGIFCDQDETGEITVEKISAFEDQLFSHATQHIRVDLFIGHKKIILRIVSEPKVQQQISTLVEKHSKWQKSK